MIYGASLPTLTYLPTGLVNGETSAVLSGSPSVSTTATSSSDVGSYAIKAASGTLAAANYTFKFVDGTLTVTPAPASVTPNDASKTYGSADPVLTGTVVGFLPGDGVSATYTRTPGESVAGSPYQVTVDSLSSSKPNALSNYEISRNRANFKIVARPASVTPNAASKPFGAVDPPLTGTLNGFLNTDAVTATYTRTPGETVAGSPYLISANLSPANALLNYNISSGTANFIILPVASIAVANVAGQYSDAVTLSATLSPLNGAFSGSIQFQVDGANAGSPVPVSGGGVYTSTYLIGKPAGSYPITAAFNALTAVTIPGVAGTLTVTKESATISPSPSNPQTVKVNAPGGTAGPITFAATITQSADGSLGSISNALVTLKLAPSIAGITPINCSVTNSAGSLTANCPSVPVGVYTVQWRTDDGNFYQSPPVDSVLAIYDPSLGFVTGGGSVNDNNVSADFGLNAKYKNDGSLQGEFTYIEHRPGGDVKIQATSVSSMSIVGSTAIILGQARINGTGNFGFQLTVTDNGEPGINRDVFGLKLSGTSLNPPINFDPAVIAAGNIQTH